LGEIDTKTRDLGIKVREITALKERIIGEADSGDDMRGTEGHLLGFGEELIDVAIEDEFTDVTDRDEVLRPDLCGVEDIEVEFVLVLFLDDLDPELPLRVASIRDGFDQVPTVVIGVLTSQLQSLVPNEGVDAELRGVDKLDKVPLTLVVDQSESVNSEALHHAVRARDCSVTHGPHEHVGTFGVEVLEVPEIVMSRLSLGYLIVGLRLCSVDNVGELDSVLDEENGNVVSNDIPVALVGVELHGEASYISDGIGGPPGAEDSRETYKDGSCTGSVIEDSG